MNSLSIALAALVCLCVAFPVADKAMYPDVQRNVVKTFECSPEDTKIRVAWERVCVGTDPLRSKQCSFDSARLFCETKY